MFAVYEKWGNLGMMRDEDGEPILFERREDAEELRSECQDGVILEIPD